MGLEITIARNSSSLARCSAVGRRTGNERKLFSCIFDAARNGRIRAHMRRDDNPTGHLQDRHRGHRQS